MGHFLDKLYLMQCVHAVRELPLSHELAIGQPEFGFFCCNWTMSWLARTAALHCAFDFILGNANPAARNLNNFHGTVEIVPFVNRTFEWGVVMATFWCDLSIEPGIVHI